MNKFQTVESRELVNIEGGIVITAGAVIGGLLFAGGVGLGVAWAFCD